VPDSARNAKRSVYQEHLAKPVDERQPLHAVQMLSCVGPRAT
jgi:hypothetical protein